jgi:hypothetical protein
MNITKKNGDYANPLEELRAFVAALDADENLYNPYKYRLIAQHVRWVTLKEDDHD